jgi:rubrerythrin
MQLRAAELRVHAAERSADDRRGERDDAVRTLAGWRLVASVLEENTTRSELAGLEERLDTIEKQTEQLRADEKRHRRALARLLTSRRDAAVDEVNAARKQLTAATSALQAADEDLESCLSRHATAAEQVRQLRSRIAESEQTISAAVAADLLPEGADPARVDAALDEQIASARRRRDSADQTLKDFDDQIGAERAALSSAQRRAATAQEDARNTERELRVIAERIAALTGDERLRAVVSDTAIDLWTERTSLTDAMARRAESADTAADDVRKDIVAAKRVVDSVGADGLLPPSLVAEDVARRCQDAEVTAWPGWRWLADTMTPGEAEAFAAARPEIASGVVIAHPDWVDRALGAIGDLDLDTAVWVGAVIDPHAAAAGGDDTDGSTRAHVLLPPPGIFDRDAARELVASATDALAEATLLLQAATQRGTDARALFAALSQLWTDLPDDPRPRLEEKIRAAHERQHAAECDARAARGRLDRLSRQRGDEQRERDLAQDTIDTAGETRLCLAPVIIAAATLAQSREQVRPLRDSVAELRGRIEELRREKPDLTAKVDMAKDLERAHLRARDDATEALRAAGLSATTDGPIPTDDDATIRARLDSVEAALADAAVDPALHQQITHARKHLADVTARLGSDADLRALAEQLATSDGARHQVALAESERAAQQREALARETYAKAEAAADAARRDYRERAEEVADRSSPDVDGFPPAASVAEPSEAERFARRLDELAAQLLDRQRVEERLAGDAEQAVRRAEESSKLVSTSAKPLRHLTDPGVTGRRAADVHQLIERVNEIADRVRTTQQSLAAGEQAQHRAADAVRAHVHSSAARKVEEREDPRVVDLIVRLRADQHLPAEAERIAGHLEQRAASLRDDLANHDQHVRTCATMLHVQAATALQRLRAYQNQSRLPQGLGDWSERRFVLIDHEEPPADESVAVDRVARVVHALLAPGAGRSDAQAMLFAAVRALVDAPFRVRLLKPHTDLTLDRVDVAELKNFSGGQRVTAGVLLYATMTRVRSVGDATSIGWLWLDNPFGQASADQFVRTMRLAADKIGLQLLFTAAPKDKGALSMFDRIIALARRSRPSSGEKVVVVDEGTRQVADLTLVQKDVLAVLDQ